MSARASALVVGLIAIVPLVAVAEEPENPDNVRHDGLTSYSIERTFRYSFTIRNSGGDRVDDATLRVFAPVERTPTQLATRLDASEKFEIVTDSRGNRTLELSVDLPPYGSKVISIESEVRFTSDPLPSPAVPDDRYLRSERFVEVDAPEIQALAQSFGSGTPEAIARQAYEWVAENIAMRGYVAEDRGAFHALRARAGDCTEAMYLFMALVRARGIPARSVEGFVTRGSGVLRAEELHNWAEYHAAGRWRLADPNQEVFGVSPDRQYLAMRVSLGAGTPEGLVRRFAISRDPLRVHMK